MSYNNQWLIEKYNTTERIQFLFFWGHQPAKNNIVTQSCFSQWWYASFEIDQVVYATAEHWMMAEKARLFNNETIREKILQCNTPAEAKKMGRLINGFIPETWDEHKSTIVVKGNLAKFSQHKELGEFLINTGDKVLVEASPVDSIWGIGMAADNLNIENPLLWKGENLLGYALMEVRDQLKQS